MYVRFDNENRSDAPAVEHPKSAQATDATRPLWGWCLKR